MNLFKSYLQRISIFNKKSTKCIQLNNNVMKLHLPLLEIKSTFQLSSQR